MIDFVHAERNGTGYPVSACALYRSHDFLQKALGNYIGLGQLLRRVYKFEFISDRSTNSFLQSEGI
jgi:hypothetical protein